VQVAPGGQGFAQPPQCAAFVFVSTHEPSQPRSPPGHWHVPPTQGTPLGHALPHRPQCSAFVAGFAQTPPQLSSLAAQVAPSLAVASSGYGSAPFNPAID
jgi:hypothetical protein